MKERREGDRQGKVEKKEGRREEWKAREITRNSHICGALA